MKKFSSIAVLALCLFLSIIGQAIAGPGAYVNIDGSTVVNDIANQHGWGGVVILNDQTVQNTSVSGTALGWNASGTGTFGQEASTALHKQSVGPFGTAEGYSIKYSSQNAVVNVAGPIALAGADLNQVNKGCLFTVAGPNSTLTVSKDIITQDMSGGVLGNGGLVLSQEAQRSTGWSALTTTPNGFTQNWGETYASAKQAKSTSCPLSCVSGSDSVKINTLTATNYVVLPGYTAANGAMGANLSANAAGNVPTTLNGSVDMGYKTFVLNGPTMITQEGHIVASVKVVK